MNTNKPGLAFNISNTKMCFLFVAVTSVFDYPAFSHAISVYNIPNMIVFCRFKNKIITA